MKPIRSSEETIVFRSYTRNYHNTVSVYRLHNRILLPQSGSSIHIRDSDLREPSDGSLRHLVPPTVLWKVFLIFQKSTDDLFSRPKIFSDGGPSYIPRQKKRNLFHRRKIFLREGIVLPRGVFDLCVLPFAPDAVPAPCFKTASHRSRIWHVHAAVMAMSYLSSGRSFNYQ